MLCRRPHPMFLRRALLASCPPAAVPLSSPHFDNMSKTFTADEVSKHNTENDCWIIINKKVRTRRRSHVGGGRERLIRSSAIASCTRSLRLLKPRTASRCSHSSHYVLDFACVVQVYDVTKFLKLHPGGKKILLGVGGQECTEQFNQFHNATAVLAKYGPKLIIGEVAGGAASKKAAAPVAAAAAPAAAPKPKPAAQSQAVINVTPSESFGDMVRGLLH